MSASFQIREPRERSVLQISMCFPGNGIDNNLNFSASTLKSQGITLAVIRWVQESPLVFLSNDNCSLFTTLSNNLVSRNFVSLLGVVAKGLVLRSEKSYTVFCVYFFNDLLSCLYRQKHRIKVDNENSRNFRYSKVVANKFRQLRTDFQYCSLSRLPNATIVFFERDLINFPFLAVGKI